MIFNPGVVLGDHYRIIQEIGAGGMGIVFKAMDTLLNRYVAIKVLTGAVDRDQRNRFLTEARATAAISHPNITTIYAIGEVESIPFIVLEFIEGIDLRSRIEK